MLRKIAYNAKIQVFTSKRHSIALIASVLSLKFALKYDYPLFFLKILVLNSRLVGFKSVNSDQSLFRG